jgi:hypothetical protein
MIIALTFSTLVLLVAGAFFIYDDWQYKKLLKKDREWQEWKLAEPR